MPADPSRVRRQLGAEIHRLRLAAGLPIRGFERPAPANLVPVPNARVQRAEKGTALLSEPQLLTILEMTGASDDVRDRLTVMLNHALSEHVRWETALEGADHLQGVAEERDRAATTISVFEYAFLPGLLQTQAYAAALMPLFGLPQDDAAAAAARMRRQEVLHEPGRTFRFVCSSHALRWAPGPDVSMDAQRDRLAQLAELDAVYVRVLPDTVRQPMSGFTLYEGMTDGTSMVAIELEHGEQPLADLREVETYRRLFATLLEQAHPIEEALR